MEQKDKEKREQNTPEYKNINRPVRKKDAMQLLLGKPVYMDDITRRDALVVKLLRSPHANAIIKEIDTSIAMKVPGVVAVYTWQDVPGSRYTNAGQTYPEPSPYDRLILDRHVRFVGDAVAIIAAENEKAALRARKLIKVKYEVLEPVLDFRKAKDNPVLVHPADRRKLRAVWQGTQKPALAKEMPEARANSARRTLRKIMCVR